jgi:hypothetical protein
VRLCGKPKRQWRPAPERSEASSQFVLLPVMFA